MSDLNDFLALIAEGKRTDPVAVKKKQFEDKIKEGVKSDLSGIFEQLKEFKTPQERLAAGEPVPNSELPEIQAEISRAIEVGEVSVQGELNEVVLPTPIGKVPEPSQIPDLDKYLKPKSETPKEAPLTNEFKQVNDKIKFLERWISQIQHTGPGSGEVNFRYLDDVNRSSIAENRQLMYDDDTKKFLFVDTRVSIEAFDRSPSIPLLATPQILKPSSFTNSKNLTYDPETGVFTFLTQCEVTLALTLNALAAASNQRVYQYAERNSGSGWVPIQNSGKNYQLTNSQHTQIVNAQTISRQAGEQIRYFIYAGEVGKVSLVTETLPNAPDVYVPAIRIQYAGR
jgi:hypothetical protein